MPASRTYSRAFKVRMVRKMLGPSAVSASQLSEETGVSQPTLSKWLRDADRILPGAPKLTVVPPAPVTTVAPAPARRPGQWSVEDKLRVLVEASQLSQGDLGSFLRSRGLHESDLQAWRSAVTEALEKPRPRGKQPASAETKRIRTLERELTRKEKALAEAAALLVLKKKLESYFGSEDEDESTTNRSERSF